MTFEVGKQYRARNGEIFTIKDTGKEWSSIKFWSEMFPILACSNLTNREKLFSENGLAGFDRENTLDLLEEVIPENEIANGFVILLKSDDFLVIAKKGFKYPVKKSNFKSLF